MLQVLILLTSLLSGLITELIVLLPAIRILLLILLTLTIALLLAGLHALVTLVLLVSFVGHEKLQFEYSVRAGQPRS